MDAWELLPWAMDRFGRRLAIVDRGASSGTEGVSLLLTYADLAIRCCHLAVTMCETGRANDSWETPASASADTASCVNVPGWSLSRGSRVGVMLRNSAAAVEAHFACAAIHAVVVNVNVSLAPAELAHVLHDSGCEVLISGVEFQAVVSAAVELLSQAPAAPSGSTLPVPLQPAAGVTACGPLRLVAWVSATDSMSFPSASSALEALTQVKFEGETWEIHLDAKEWNPK